MNSKRWVVVVSGHAIQRARERTSLQGCDSDIQHAIVQSVLAALEDGRTSKRCPRWAEREWLCSSRQTGEKSQRFLWDVSEQRCFVIRRGRRRDKRGREGEPWIVVTVLAAGMGVLQGVHVARVAVSRR